jgi:hypothetical protein
MITAPEDDNSTFIYLIFLFVSGNIIRRQSGIVIGAGSQMGHFNGYIDNVSFW